MDNSTQKNESMGFPYVRNASLNNDEVSVLESGPARVLI
jgi:hypothetical protein